MGLEDLIERVVEQRPMVDLVLDHQTCIILEIMALTTLSKLAGGTQPGGNVCGDLAWMKSQKRPRAGAAGPRRSSTNVVAFARHGEVGSEANPCCLPLQNSKDEVSVHSSDKSHVCNLSWQFRDASAHPGSNGAQRECRRLRLVLHATLPSDVLTGM